MARYTGPKVAVCRRLRHQHLEGAKGDDKCPREAAVPAGRARPHPPAQRSEYLLQLQEKQKARCIYGLHREAVPQPLRGGQPPPGRHRREPAPLPRAAPRQRRVPRRLGSHPPAGPPVRAPRPRRRSTAAGSTSRATASARATSSRSATRPRDDRRPAQPRHARPRTPAVARDRRRRLGRHRARAARCREQIDVPVREQLIVELYSK